MISALTAQQKLDLLYSDLESSVDLLPLAHSTQDIVPGEGDPSAQILAIGEAPGAKEAQLRRPFVGRSGQLFRSVLKEQAGILDSTVYITNIVKVRPPQNRDPSREEIQAYSAVLDREIAIVDPQLIITLGRISMAKFLPKVKISQVHGKLHAVVVQGYVRFIMPMYHPAAALRSRKMKAAFTADFAKIPAVLRWLKEYAHSYRADSVVTNVIEIVL